MCIYRYCSIILCSQSHVCFLAGIQDWHEHGELCCVPQQRVSLCSPVLQRKCRDKNEEVSTWWSHILYLTIYGGFLKWGTPKSSTLMGLSIINHPCMHAYIHSFSTEMHTEWNKTVSYDSHARTFGQFSLPAMHPRNKHREYLDYRDLAKRLGTSSDLSTMTRGSYIEDLWAHEFHEHLWGIWGLAIYIYIHTTDYLYIW